MRGMMQLCDRSVEICAAQFIYALDPWYYAQRVAIMRLKQWIMRGAIHLCIGSMVLCAENVIYAFEAVDYAQRNSFMH